MHNIFVELTKSLAQCVKRCEALRRFSAGLAGMTLAASLPLHVMAAKPATMTSSVADSAGDAVFPFDLYNGPVPLVIRGDTYVFETSAASLGDPASFDWAVASECDPVPVPEETNKTLLIVDYAPDNGYTTWPSPQP